MKCPFLPLDFELHHMTCFNQWKPSRWDTNRSLEMCFHSGACCLVPLESPWEEHAPATYSKEGATWGRTSPASLMNMADNTASWTEGRTTGERVSKPPPPSLTRWSSQTLLSPTFPGSQALWHHRQSHLCSASFRWEGLKGWTWEQEEYFSVLKGQHFRHS